MPLPRRRPPALGVTQLEDRTVPAVGDLYLSEALFDPLFLSPNSQQYLELRGKANATVAAGTYLVVLDGDAPGTNSEPGRTNAVFDLGGLKLGSDGYLVILQGGVTYPTRAGATVIQGTDPGGFGGLPGGRFAGSAAIGSALEFIFGANTFLLVEAPTRPTPNTDYDTNDDGTLDGGALRWNVLDSVGVLGTFVGGDANQIGYGKINFAVGGLGKVPAGSTKVTALDFGYVARVGESTGFAPADWVAAQVIDNNGTAGSPNFRLESSLFGFPTVGYLAGRTLDHLGTANFVASAGGTKFLDANANGARDPGEGPLAGATFWADRNRNGIQDSYTTAVDADSFPAGAELTNAVPGVTFTEEGHLGNSIIFGRSIAASEDPGNTSTGTRAFGRNGINWFDDGSRLRMDFYKPVRTLSIDFIAGALTDYYGRLNAYSADGTLLATYLSGPLQSSVTTLSITRPQADIAYATAYSDPAGFPFGRLDNLVFSQPEDTATSDAAGAYRVDGLQDGVYRVRETRRAGFAQTFPNSPSYYDATVAAGTPVRNLDFGNAAGGGVGLVGATALVAGAAGGQAVVYPAAGDGSLNPGTAIPLPVIPFNSTPFGGVLRSTSADVDGDGVPDYVVVTGPGAPARFAVVDGVDAITLLIPPTPVFAGSEDFAGGAFVSAGDIDADGRAELVFTPDQGGGPRVTIYTALPGGLTVRANFLGIADANFRGGARSAVGDVNGDGRADLLVAAGFGGGPRVSLYDGRTVLGNTRTRLVGDFFAFDQTLRNGAFAAIGDVDGDGKGDLVLGAGSGGAPRVLVVSGATLTAAGSRAALASPISNFFVGGDTTSRGGSRVSVLDVDGDRRADVAVGSGENEAGRVRLYLGSYLVGSGGEPAGFQDIAAFGGAALTDGVFVG